MSDYQFGYCTDIGIKKPVNQDSLLIREAVIEDTKVLLALVCDGMGGLSKGELASASVVKAFDKWFQNEFPAIFQAQPGTTEAQPASAQAQSQNAQENEKAQWNGLDTNTLKAQWNELIQRANSKLFAYGNENGFSLGTTLTAILLLAKEGKGQYFVAQVGDSRCYQIFPSQGGIMQLTEDQSFVAREVRRGNMTKEQAARDPRKNVLLQCIGASRTVEPEFYDSMLLPPMSEVGFMLCSDGFRHKVSDEEFLMGLRQAKNSDSINASLKNLVELNMRREETDNITALYIAVNL